MTNFNAIMKAINDCGLTAKITWDDVTKIYISTSLENIETDPDYAVLNDLLDSEKMIDKTYYPQFNFDGFIVTMEW